MLTIRKRDPAKRMARFYRLALQRCLPLSQDGETDKPVAPERSTTVANSIPIPEAVDLVREWGRIGSPGTVRIDGFSNEAEARSAGARLAQQKHRKGYR
jgi:predicted DNA-binding WGR domain protein